ncbi:MAG: RNA polymerase sigma factor [Planctomycetota bacterium]
MTESGVVRAQAGAPEDVEAFALAFLPRVYGLTLRLTRDRQLAEEATQEAYLKILKNLPKLRRPERVDSWVLRIAGNAARDLFRAREATVSLDYEPPAIPQGERDWERARRRAIDLALDDLDYEQRELFLLHTVEGVRLKDLARDQEQSLSALTSRLHRVRAKVRERARHHLRDSKVLS